MGRAADDGGTHEHWLVARRDPETGIESLRAHFSGHAYDPHDHDDMLIGFTEQGVQRFQCHRSLHTSVPGRAILIEPGATHDGHAPEAGGFTYSMLYLPQAWVERAARRIDLPGLSGVEAAFGHTLVDDRALVEAIRDAFVALHGNEGKLARDQTLDRLLTRLGGQLRASSPTGVGGRDVPPAIARARAAAHANGRQPGARRTRRTRRRRSLPAHAAVPARLRHVAARVSGALAAAARRCSRPAARPWAAADVGFADQSHLGRWFAARTG
jgi:hypothetical protein